MKPWEGKYKRKGGEGISASEAGNGTELTDGGWLHNHTGSVLTFVMSQHKLGWV